MAGLADASRRPHMSLAVVNELSSSVTYLLELEATPLINNYSHAS